MENGLIKDKSIRATSSRPLSMATYARLNQIDGYGGWCPDQRRYENETATIHKEFIQVQFDTSLRIKGIVTQGRYEGVEKVEQYWISYSTEEKKTFDWYLDGENIRPKVCTNKLSDTFDKILYTVNVSQTIWGGSMVDWLGNRLVDLWCGGCKPRPSTSPLTLFFFLFVPFTRPINMTSSQFFSFTWNLLFYASLTLKSSMVTMVTNTDMLWLNFFHREKKVFLLSAHLLFRIFTTSFQKKKFIWKYLQK